MIAVLVNAWRFSWPSAPPSIAQRHAGQRRGIGRISPVVDRGEHRVDRCRISRADESADAAHTLGFSRVATDAFRAAAANSSLAMAIGEMATASPCSDT